MRLRLERTEADQFGYRRECLVFNHLSLSVSFPWFPFFFFSPLDRDKDERQSMDFDLSSSMEPSSRRDRAVDRVLIYLNNL